ncbi:MAG: hypothetical protein ACJ70X_10185, partial [Nitrososphaera sp.]
SLLLYQLTKYFYSCLYYFRSWIVSSNGIQERIYYSGFFVLHFGVCFMPQEVAGLYFGLTHSNQTFRIYGKGL